VAGHATEQSKMLQQQPTVYLLEALVAANEYPLDLVAGSQSLPAVNQIY